MTEGTGNESKTFDVQKIIEDSKNVLLKPKEYFASMPKTGGLGEPIIKALVYGTIAGLISMIWAIIGFGAVGSMFGAGASTGIAAGITVLITTIIVSLIGVFIGGVIVLVISAICGGTTDFEANLRVSASLMVVYPINSLLGFLSGIHFSLGAIVSLVVSLYSLYLLYMALTNALEGKEGTAKIVSIVLGIIPVLMLVSALICTQAIKSGADNYMRKGYPYGNKSDQKKVNDALKKLRQLQNNN